MSGHTLFGQAALKPFRYTDPADKLHGEGYVYAISFDSGLTKVGQTVQPRQRITSHVDSAAVHGATPVGAWLSLPHANVKDNEQALIDYCGGIATSQTRSEYFVGVGLTELVAYAESLSYERLDEANSEAHAPITGARSGAALARKIRTGKVVVLTADEFEDHKRKLDRAEEIIVSLKLVLGTKELSLTKLPQRLRHAADIVEAFPRVRGDWMRLLPGVPADESAGCTCRDESPTTQ